MSQDGEKRPTPRPVVFLDTNALHFSKITLALGAVREYDVLAEGVDSFKDKLRNWRVGAVCHYEKGYWIARYLKRRTEEGADLLYSPITELELLCGSLRGEAIKRAVNAGVPNRWFSRVGEREIRDYLEPDGYERVRTEQADVGSLFDGAEITLSAPPLDAEVWLVAQAILENTFIEVQDCLVYASALVNQANELVTTDGYLRETVGWTHNPGSARASLEERYRSVRQALISTCATMIGCGESEVVLPEGKGVPQIRQFLDEPTP